MSTPNPDIDASLLEFYRLEAEDQTRVLVERLLALERWPTAPDHLEACMRAAHSLKGAARIIGFEAGVKAAHAMEDCFVAAQRGTLVLNQQQIDAFLRDVDLLRDPCNAPEKNGTVERAQSSAPDRHATVSAVLPTVVQTTPASLANGNVAAEPSGDDGTPSSVSPAPDAQRRREQPLPAAASEASDRMLRVTADHLDRLLRLAGESLVEARRQKRGDDHAQQLYDAALACRMRPFADGTHGLARMMRDLARSLGKSVRFEIRGEATQVDRDILAVLEAPLGHLLRNAVDHAIEAPDERRAAGKPDEGAIILEARHNAGILQVSVSDDGRGIELDRVRQGVVRRGLASADNVAKLSETELLEFLFLPGFTLADAVTEVSGRGVGLDVVREAVQKVHGKVRVATELAKGTRFQLQLPLTLSVQRTLLVEVADEPYALPLASITRTSCIARDRIEHLEGHWYYHDGVRGIGLVGARHLLHAQPPLLDTDELNVVVLGSHEHVYGLLVDRFLGERELVVRALDPRLGKIKDVAAAAVMDDGAPVLILDVEDVVRSMEKLLREGGRSSGSSGASNVVALQARRRVLVVDDSLTVRELERKLLSNQGYHVDVATDGVDGWNTARNGRYDLVITDVDMPRMDGIELIARLKKDPHLKAIPVLIVSYKDRAEDRRRGLEAGADRYLAKGSFHDDALLEAVRDLVGEATSAGGAA